MDKVKPIHDTNIGLLHPYWARKPLNILEAIVSVLTEEGDLVVDPFMGSGTTLYAAANTGRQAFGSDISPLSHFIVGSSIRLVVEGREIMTDLNSVVEKFLAQTLPWFNVGENDYVERIHYEVRGNFAHGEFELEPVGYVSKRRDQHGGWGQRRTHDSIPPLGNGVAQFEDQLQLDSQPLDFARIALPQNSRIAIPEGAHLSDFFSAFNRRAINAYLQIADESSHFVAHPEMLKFPLSATLPMLRLSDKKASSQWPYWRPKRNLTSRTPGIVISQKMRAIEKLVSQFDGNPISRAYGGIGLAKVAAQDLTPHRVGAKAKLVLTDPPYGDQVPYLEYSNLWNAVLGYGIDTDDYRKELTLSNAPFLSGEAARYDQKLREAFLANAELVAPGGYLVWFYQDHWTDRWATLSSCATEAGMTLAGVFPLPKQRRSFKTVTSPNRTLDGDLVTVFYKGSADSKMYSRVQALRESLPELPPSNSFFSRHARVLGDLMATGEIHEVANTFRKITDYSREVGGK